MTNSPITGFVCDKYYPANWNILAEVDRANQNANKISLATNCHHNLKILLKFKQVVLFRPEHNYGLFVLHHPDIVSISQKTQILKTIRQIT